MIKAGLPVSAGAITVNKVCGSGLQAVMFARREILVDDADVLVAGGMESMTNAPYVLPKARAGYRMGNGKIVDTMIHDGLWDPYDDMHMGNCGDLVAEKYGFTREDQDAFAARATGAPLSGPEGGRFKEEIVPVSVPQRRGEPLLVDEDEEPKARRRSTRWRSCGPPSPRRGRSRPPTPRRSTTARPRWWSARRRRAKPAGLQGARPHRRRLRAAVEPKWFTIAPVRPWPRLYQKTDTKAGDWDLYEINEAFSGVTMAAAKEHGIDMDRVNVNGGAVSLGHPIGCSGARVLVTLLHALKDRGQKRGIATLCIGGGEAVALGVELV